MEDITAIMYVEGRIKDKGETVKEHEPMSMENKQAKGVFWGEGVGNECAKMRWKGIAAVNSGFPHPNLFHSFHSPYSPLPNQSAFFFFF